MDTRRSGLPRFRKVRSWIALAGVAQLWSSSGCSVAFIDGPPTAHATMPYFDCTSSDLAPNLDITMAGLLGLGAYGASNDTQSPGAKQGEVTLVVMTAGLLASAVYGWKVTDACQRAKNQLSVRLAKQTSGPVLGDSWIGSNQDVLQSPAPVVSTAPAAPSNVSATAATKIAPPPSPSTADAPTPPPTTNVPPQRLRAPVSTPSPRPQP